MLPVCKRLAVREAIREIDRKRFPPIAKIANRISVRFYKNVLRKIKLSKDIFINIYFASCYFEVVIFLPGPCF
ncbi:MAG TPA: hypothetical protein DEF39_06725 [Hungateiclostridium thermocellum]|nr:hypothetical protein [Acetivibrio thermocellus]